ncbi:MAG TPA: hypothetical protein VMZ51_07995 [Acidimicrobiales bacterium]|nr:hypothetical protein [Acidimicrobiales bacterium]
MTAMSAMEQDFYGHIDCVVDGPEDEPEGDDMCDDCGTEPGVQWDDESPEMLCRRCAIEAHEAEVADEQLAALKEGDVPGEWRF